LLGCLPERYLDNDRFVCPECYKSTGLAPLYAVPSRSAASSHSGVNTSPLIVYIVYSDEGAHSCAPPTIIEGQVRGYYYGKEEQLLVLLHSFKDLSDRDEKLALTKNLESMAAFMCTAPKCRLILLLQTHSDPSSGLLHFADQKATTIDAILEYIFKTLRFHQLSNSVLLLSSCGYFGQKHLNSLRSAVSAFGFNSCFSFTGHALDPLLVAVTLYYNILDFHIIGNESPRMALERSACSSLLSNTSVVLLDGENGWLLSGAAIRYRPNGEYVSCTACCQPFSFKKLAPDGQAAVFRCRQVEHPNNVPRYQKIPLLQSDHSRTVVGGLNDRCRYILTRIFPDA